MTRNVLSACCPLGSNLMDCDWPMAQCSHGRSVVTSDLSDFSAGCCNCNQKCPIPMQHLPGNPRRLRHLTSPALPSLPPARPQLPQANTRAESHSTLHQPRMSPHSASRTVSGSMDASMALWNLRALAGRHLPFADTDRRRTQTRSSMVCNLWRVPVASWSSTIPLGHWGYCSHRPRRRPYPRACLLLHTSSSLLAEISALLASLACRQRAKNAQSLFCFCWMGASGLPG